MILTKTILFTVVVSITDLAVSQSLYRILYSFLFMMTARIQTYTVAVIAAVLFGVSVLISTSMTSTADGQVQEKTNRQLEQVVKALDSGDIAAAKGYMNETFQGLPEGAAKMHLGEAIKALQSDDTEGAKMHVQLALQG